MELYNLGIVPWQQSQLLYHALAHLGREAICICSPATPYFCIGCHQDVTDEVDLDFCTKNSIPVFRREVGGGGVYLDADQFFSRLFSTGEAPMYRCAARHSIESFLSP